METKREIQIESLKNISHNQLINLYQQGYRISNTKQFTYNNIKSLAISDIGTMQYVWLGLESYVAYKSFKTNHEIIGIIFSALALGSLGAIYTNYKKPESTIPP